MKLTLINFQTFVFLGLKKQQIFSQIKDLYLAEHAGEKSMLPLTHQQRCV